MLNSKVEHCPNCGKIKSKFKGCKSCGFDESVEITESFRDDYKYFVSYAFNTSDKEFDTFSVGCTVIPSCHEFLSLSLIEEAKRLLEEMQKTKVVLLNIIKLEY